MVDASEPITLMYPHSRYEIETISKPNPPAAHSKDFTITITVQSPGGSIPLRPKSVTTCHLTYTVSMLLGALAHVQKITCYDSLGYSSKSTLNALKEWLTDEHISCDSMVRDPTYWEVVEKPGDVHQRQVRCEWIKGVRR